MQFHNKQNMKTLLKSTICYSNSLQQSEGFEWNTDVWIVRFVLKTHSHKNCNDYMKQIAENKNMCNVISASVSAIK